MARGEIKALLFAEGVDVTAPTALHLTSPILTTPDIDGGTASNSSRITLPKNTKSALDGLTRKEGTVVYATDLKRAFVDDGASLVEVGSGSGSGSGEINLLSNPSGGIDTSGWTTSGDATITRIATGGPLGPGIPTALRIDAGNPGDYVEAEFTVPAALANYALKLEWFQAPESGAGTGEWEVEIYKGETRLPLTSDDDTPQTLIPNTTGKITGIKWDSGAADTDYKVRFTRVTGSSHLDLTNIVVGPGNVTVMADGTNAIESYTPSFLGLGTPTGVEFWYGFRNANPATGTAVLWVEGRGTTGTVTQEPLYIGIPDGLEIAGANKIIGRWIRESGVATHVKSGPVVTDVNNTRTAVGWSYDERDLDHSASTRQSANNVIGSSEDFWVYFEVPVTGYVPKNGVANLFQNDDEALKKWQPYTPTVENFDGLAIANGVWRRVDQEMEIKVYVARNGGAYSGTDPIKVYLPDGFDIDTDAFPAGYGNRIEGKVTGYSAGTGSVFSVQTTHIGNSVAFSGYGTSNSVNNWSDTFPWNNSDSAEFMLVAKVPIVQWKNKTSGIYGVAHATATQSGLVKGGKVPGSDGSSATEAGYIGEVRTAYFDSGTITTSAVHLVSILNVTPGVYMARLTFSCSKGSASSVLFAINDGAAIGVTYGDDYVIGSVSGDSATLVGDTVKYMRFSTTGTVYGVFQSVDANCANAAGTLQIIRVG